MTTLKERFAARFGADQADAIQAAAEYHDNDINGENKGSDHFRWALSITIGYECWSKDKYREFHHITAPIDEIRQWIKDEGEMDKHDGDCDYLALFAGAYNDYMPAKESGN